MPRVIGIDPGIHGAIAVFDPKAVPRISVHDFPSVKVRVGSKNRTRLDIDECWAVIKQLTAHRLDLCLFEDVNGYAGNTGSTGSSSFTFGRAAGAIEGMVVAARVPRDYVTPAAWKRHMRIKGKGAEGKNASRLAAKRLFPDAANLFARVKDDGRAEAALIAYYAATQILGYVPA